MKHTCPYPDCGRFVRWSLLFCFDHNALLRKSGGTVVVDGEHQYPPHQAN